MATSSRAQVLRLYRALLRESQRFSSYNYRLLLASCIPHRNWLLRVQETHSYEKTLIPEATLDHLQHPTVPHTDASTHCTCLSFSVKAEEMPERLSFWQPKYYFLVVHMF
ncbi:LYR motif-containing protein 4 isoform X1 [Colius striatus]|uniref:LYR motif-containing protein 4 isoform X1 n=1 Tax=Colius striatus TaxID=57412 RepID=UPI002B1D6F3E|nr:LYR motif-containing protein 4 isoform X1 [Colius striatus]